MRNIAYISILASVLSSCFHQSFGINGEYENTKYGHYIVIKDSTYYYRIGEKTVHKAKFEYSNNEASFYNWKSFTPCGFGEDVGVWVVPYDGLTLHFSPDEPECDFVHQ